MGLLGLKTPNNKTVLVSVCIAVVALMIDTSIVRIYRFIAVPISPDRDIITFVAIAIIYTVVQLIILRTLSDKKEVSKWFISNLTHNIVLGIQCSLVMLLILIIFQMVVNSAYNIVVIAIAIAISYILAIFMSGFLASRFFSWFRSTKNSIVFAYGLAAASSSINALFTLLYVLYVLQGVSPIVEPHIGHIAGYAPYSKILGTIYIVSAVLSFMITWCATVLLMRAHSKTLGSVKYWILVVVPMAYFMIQFQPFFLDLILAYHLSNPILFDVLYTVIFNLTKPVGGILFGIAFWIMARRVHHDSVKNYLMIAGYGLLLLFTSNQATVLINSPYPPFGMAAISFVGLSSYFVLIGVYSSAVSVAQDIKLRKSIQSSVQRQLDLLHNIGTAEMQTETVRKIFKVTKDLSTELSENSGVEPSLDDEDISNYLAQVLKETRAIKKDSNINGNPPGVG